MSEVEVQIGLPDRRGHAHRHSSAHGSRRRLSIVLLLTAVYLVAELLGGLWTGSLALLADAGHMLADVAALVLALMAVWFGARPATPRKTFGYYRLEIIAALINGVGLVLISFLIFFEAYQRWFARPDIRSGAMTVVAVGGLIVNLICALLLHRDRHQDLNLEGTPAHINLAAVEQAIKETDGVSDVHDLHVWTITSGREALSAHVIHAYSISQPNLLKELREKLLDRFGVDHLTIQMETPDFEDEAIHFCHAGTACFRSGRE